MFRQADERSKAEQAHKNELNASAAAKSNKIKAVNQLRQLELSGVECINSIDGSKTMSDGGGGGAGLLILPVDVENIKNNQEKGQIDSPGIT